MKKSETIEHIVLGCIYIANTEYLKRHILTAIVIYQTLALKYKLVDNAAPYKYVLSPFLENEIHKLYCDQSILSDEPIASNRPYITPVDKTSYKVFLIYISHANDVNLQQKKKEKITKFQYLCEEFTQSYNEKYMCNPCGNLGYGTNI